MLLLLAVAQKTIKPDKVIKNTFNVDDEIIKEMEESLNAAKENGFNPYTSIRLNGSTFFYKMLTVEESTLLI